jgi:histidyl-tRNA synthetase
MVSKVYAASPKPIKYFSIANFMRNEKPQRGRNREFWQLNCDIFGSANPSSDIEILTLALDLVLEFKPPKNSFSLHLNSRQLIDGVLDLAGASKLKPESKAEVVRTLDKWKKLSAPVIYERLQTAGLKKEAIMILEKFMACADLLELSKKLPELKNNIGFIQIQEAMSSLTELGYGNLIEFDPSVIRGFDYYDGLVFEVFDKHPDNNRAMFGGGRYNGLAEIFGEKNFPAIGFAPGDEPARLFLESWGLLKGKRYSAEEKYYFPLLNQTLYLESQKLVKNLRAAGKNVFVGLEEQKITKALEFANKKGFDKVVIFGEDEHKKHKYKIKDMKTGKEQVAS